MLIVGFRELILDDELALDVLHLSTLLFFGIVSPEGTGSSLVPYEIPIDSGEFTLLFEPLHINVFGFQTKEDLGS